MDALYKDGWLLHGISASSSTQRMHITLSPTCIYSWSVCLLLLFCLSCFSHLLMYFAVGLEFSLTDRLVTEQTDYTFHCCRACLYSKHVFWEIWCCMYIYLYYFCRERHVEWITWNNTPTCKKKKLEVRKNMPCNHAIVMELMVQYGTGSYDLELNP